MSAIVKGRAGATLRSRTYEYDVQTGDYYRIDEYEGSEAAMNGLANTTRKASSHSITTDSGTGRATFRTPIVKGAEDVQLRYEILSEVVDKEIWSHPRIVQIADAYNLSADVVNGMSDPFRKTLELISEEGGTFTDFDAATQAVGRQVIQMLRNGVTEWEIEYIVLRRSRRVPNPNTSRSPLLTASIGEVPYIYSTAQLLLPATIAFQVPDSSLLTPRNAFARWGWRRRPSTSVYDANWIEQTGEFLLAEWDLLLYTDSTSDAGW